MAYVAVASFFISELRLWGAFSPIHLLSAWTLFSLLYIGALLITGLFTLWPGRVTHGVLFGL